MLHDVLDLYESLGLRSLIGEYLGTRPVLSANKCTLRRVPTSASGGWHQDGAFLGSGIRAMNVWLALTPCGVDAPGLDIVPRRFDGIVETGTAGSYFTWAAGDEAVAGAAGGAPVVRPEFRAGDMLLFDDLLMHRTAVDPAMTRERHAIEFWCFAGGAYPPDEIPLVW
jgi:ectoine hydroxylase-related dioxygenase (phytanoyl-CoA dioxygenase family)